MSYLVLARKFRPQSFAEVTGQEHVTRTLGNAIRRDKVAHAYLFAGPRGVGKTSIARIFSKCLNCEKGPTATPCLKCDNCVGITQGTSLAVREIDGASHNSVDNVRELIENFRALPAPGSKYKIYIIDEVHMLSVSAFNALLKSLEEPPPHTIFILATTEAHKIPETVLSRCQRHDLRALQGDQVEERLKSIATAEKMKVEEGVFRMIARLSDGSMRDAQSLFDRVQSFCEDSITVKEAGQVLGIVDKRILFKLSGAVFARDPSEALKILTEVFAFGVDPTLFLKEFVTHWRELLIAKASGEQGLLRVGVGGADAQELVAQVTPLTTHDVQDLAYLGREGADSATRSAYPKYALEALVVRMATRESVRDIGAILAQLREGIGAARPESVRTDSGSRSSPTPIQQRSPDSGYQSSPKIIRPLRPQDAGLESAAAPKESSAKPSALRWDEFVRESKGIISEQLKRLSVEVFVPGELKARGPDFSITYFHNKDNKEKLEALLASYTQVTSWKLSLSPSNSNGDPEPGSLLHSERQVASQTREDKTRDISNHPKIKSLQKVFPGSTIENIKIK